MLLRGAKHREGSKGMYILYLILGCAKVGHQSQYINSSIFPISHCIDKIFRLEIELIEFLYFYLDIIIHYFIISMAKGGIFMTEIKSNC